MFSFSQIYLKFADIFKRYYSDSGAIISEMTMKNMDKYVTKNNKDLMINHYKIKQNKILCIFHETYHFTYYFLITHTALHDRIWMPSIIPVFIYPMAGLVVNYGISNTYVLEIP